MENFTMAPTDLWELPNIHVSSTIGYRDWKDKTGKEKRSIVMTHEGLLNTFEVGLTYMKLVNFLAQRNNLPPNWNNHDHSVITGLLNHIGPYDVKINNKLCNFLDPIEDQLDKHYKAIQKLHLHVDKEKITRDEYYQLMGIDKPQREVTKKESFIHCEQRRKLEQACGVYKTNKRRK